MESSQRTSGPFIVAFDADGTLFDTITLVGRILGNERSLDEFTDYRKVFSFYGEDEFRNAVKKAHAMKRKLMPISKDTVSSVREIMDMPGVLCYVLTANDDDAAPRIHSWLKYHGIDMPVITAGVGNSKSKVYFKYDIIVDDHPDIVAECEKAGKKAIGFPAPYNSYDRSVSWSNIKYIVADAMVGSK
jgi:phosphoserine phosphatase